MTLDNFDYELMNQKIGDGNIKYFFSHGIVYDRNKIITTISQPATSIISGGYTLQFTDSESWIKFEDDSEPDLIVKIPNYIPGNKIIMLGATATNSVKSLTIKRIAIWNMNTRKGHLMYKSVPEENVNLHNTDDHDFVRLGTVCLSSRDDFLGKILIIALPLITVISAIAVYFTRSKFTDSLIVLALGVIITIMLTNLFMGQSRSMISERVFRISKNLNCDLIPNSNK